jgi:hypothetical protein
MFFHLKGLITSQQNHQYMDHYRRINEISFSRINVNDIQLMLTLQSKLGSPTYIPTRVIAYLQKLNRHPKPDKRLSLLDLAGITDSLNTERLRFEHDLAIGYENLFKNPNRYIEDCIAILTADYPSQTRQERQTTTEIVQRLSAAATYTRLQEIRDVEYATLWGHIFCKFLLDTIQTGRNKYRYYDKAKPGMIFPMEMRLFIKAMKIADKAVKRSKRK